MTRRVLPLLLLACAEEPEPVEVDAAAWVVRASLDLRGVRPSLDEIARVHADPSAADALIDDFLADPRFGDRLADLYAELYRTRTETWPVSPSAAGVADEVPLSAYVASLGEEPLQVIARVAREDLPWTELVLADWTMADDVLARIWPLEVEPGEGWRVARYTDGRPAAGLLASNSLWWRYGSTASNANRGRAAQVSRLFLCVDYAETPVPFDPSLDLLDEEAVRNAVRTHGSCTVCHDRLDPLAAFFFGFHAYDPGSLAEVGRYHPERERLWAVQGGLPPALEGRPGYTLRDLGVQIARDPRFPECAVEQAFRMVLRRAPEGEADEAAALAVRNAFVAGGLRARALYGALVRTDVYRRRGEGGLPLRVASPDLLASQVEDLTGFRWTTPDGWDVLRTELVGLRSLAGGADGRNATRHADVPSATVLLVQERLAEAAAVHVVRHDAAVAPAERRLLRAVDPRLDRQAAGPAFTEQLVQLHARIFGRDVASDGPEVTAHGDLFDAVHAATGDPLEAWAAVVAAMLRDPDLLLY